MNKAASNDRISIRTILLATIGVLTLLIILQATSETYAQWSKLARIKELKKAAYVSDNLFDAVEKISIERDIAFSILHTDDVQTLIALRVRLKASRKQADEAWDVAIQQLEQYDFNEVKIFSTTAKKSYAKLIHQRQKIDEAMDLPVNKRNKVLSDQWFADSTSMILQIQRVWMTFIKQFSDIDPVVTLHLRYKHFLGIIMEYTGRERAVIGRLIVENADPTPQEQAQLLRWQGAVELGWERVGTLADQGGLYNSVSSYLKDARSHYQTVYDMIGDSFYTPGLKHGASYPISVEMWLEVASQANDSLYALKSTALKKTKSYMDLLEGKARQAIYINAAVLIFTLLVCTYSFWLITRRVINPVNEIIEALVNTMQGNYSPMPQMNESNDEIGKLAQVLNVLQTNMDEIKRYTADLERSNKELDDFAYIASHDLKEPLRGLHNHARFLLEDNMDRLEPESVNRLNRLIYLTQRMERLVNDLLYFSRLGRQELAVQPTDINLVIHDIETTLEHLFNERKVRIIIPKKLPTITCDKTRVTEVFRNLITNAAKYNDKENKKIEIGFLELQQYKDKEMLEKVFYVKDNGFGIAPEFYDEIFRIFKRLQSSKNKEEEGTGVGLTFVKKIIERHGGRIWLESLPGQGTIFYFTLKE